MNRTIEKVVALAFLAATGAVGAQQPAPAPTQPAAQPQQPAERPVLRLRLDESDSRPSVTFTPKGGERKPEAQNLPELGGNAKQIERSTSPWDKLQPGDVIPKPGCTNC